MGSIIYQNTIKSLAFIYIYKSFLNSSPLNTAGQCDKCSNLYTTWHHAWSQESKHWWRYTPDFSLPLLLSAQSILWKGDYSLQLSCLLPNTEVESAATCGLWWRVWWKIITIYTYWLLLASDELLRMIKGKCYTDCSNLRCKKQNVYLQNLQRKRLHQLILLRGWSIYWKIMMFSKTYISGKLFYKWISSRL